MRRAVWWTGSCLLVVVALAAPARPAYAQNTVHNDCDYCHNVHGGGGFILATDYNRDVDLCLSCHDDGAPPTYNGETVPKGVAVHAGADHAAADTTSCVDCHDHEGEAGGNLALIPRQLNSRYTGLKTVVFTARTGANSFADGNTTYDGVCEVCHTQTTQHRADGSAGQHNAAADCTTCHRHDTGFQGAGGCTVCHSTPQDNGDGVPVGGRRAVVGEFALASHHVVVTPADSIPDGDCTTCHDMAQHQQGSVRLKNADNAGIVYALTGDPATNSTEAAKLTDFCLSCHDPDAAGGSTPFSDGVTPPVIDNSYWVASSHEQSVAIVGCYGNGQFGCHASGHGSEKIKLLAPAGVAPTPPANTEEEEGFCFACHDADGPAGTNIQSEFAKGTNTSTQIFHHPVTDSEQPSGRPVECADCHNPHQARSDVSAPTAPMASGRLLGVTRVTVTNGAAGTVPAYTLRSAADPAAPREYEICFKCHSSWTAQPAGQTDLAVKLNTNNASYHPVEGVGKNTNIRAGAFVNGWAADRTVFCADCHSSDNTAVRGPHGSSNRYLLKNPYTASSMSRTMSSGEICFDCHNYDTYANDQSSNTVQGYSRFNAPSWTRGHTFHVDQRNRPCYACHDTHGAATQPHLIVTGRNPGLNSYTESPTGGTCSPTCHGSETYDINYAR